MFLVLGPMGQLRIQSLLLLTQIPNYRQTLKWLLTISYLVF